MALPNIMQTGRTGMVASKAKMGTSSHNIANANTEGFSRQRVETEADLPKAHGSKNLIGTGTLLSSTERVNDVYLEKQLREAAKNLGNLEEKGQSLKQVEDIFNEMGGEGLNRLMAKFFNDFRKLSLEPDSRAVRQAVQESAAAMVGDFGRLRTQVEEVRAHLDSRLEGLIHESNSYAENIKDLNERIRTMELSGASANDLKDKRDVAVKKLAGYMDMSFRSDEMGAIHADIKNVGPLLSGPSVMKLSVDRSPADKDGKRENSYSVRGEGSASDDLTHSIKGGRIGALLETRDKVLSKVLENLDTLAFSLSEKFNSIHSLGFDAKGGTGANFFKPILDRDGAARFFQLSDEIRSDPARIAAAGERGAAGDNRIALAMAQIQNEKFLEDGTSTVDDYFNAIVADVGVASGRTQGALQQQKDISIQLQKMRDQVSGVSIDEETANLIQFQHVFGASAKVIQVADECLKTVLDLR